MEGSLERLTAELVEGFGEAGEVEGARFNVDGEAESGEGSGCGRRRGSSHELLPVAAATT